MRAVDGVSFDIRRGECLGLVGESGCGKTTVSKILMRAVTPDSGTVIFDGGHGPIDLLAAEGDELQDAAHQDPDGVPGSGVVAVAAHDGAEHPQRAAGNP